MGTVVFLAVLATAVAVRVWASVEISRLQASDPKFAQLMRRAQSMA